MQNAAFTLGKANHGRAKHFSSYGFTQPHHERLLRVLKWVLAAALQYQMSVPAFAGDLTVPPPPRQNRNTELQFALYRGYLIVADGRLGSLEHANLLLDTGTSPSMIDKSISERLGLKGAPRPVSLFNTDVRSESVVLPDFQLGPLERHDFPVMVADFSKISSDLGTRVDGVIGLDVLGATSFTIDYKKRRIAFHASRQRHSVAFNAGPQFVTVDLKAGGHLLHLLLDTGTPHLVLFQDALRHLDYDWSATTGSGQNISGNVNYGTIILPEAQFGGENVGPQRASVVATQQNIARDYDGLLGISVLRPTRLSFDFENRVLGWSN